MNTTTTITASIKQKSVLKEVQVFGTFILVPILAYWALHENLLQVIIRFAMFVVLKCTLIIQ